MKISTPSTHETDKRQDSARASKVWVQLGEMFGRAFYREMGNEPPSLWVSFIEHLSDEAICRGLKNLADEDFKFPPNLSQFKSACGRVPPRRFNGVRSLPNPIGQNTKSELTAAEKQKAMAARAEAIATARFLPADR